MTNIPEITDKGSKARDMLIDNIQGVTGNGADEPKGCITILDECSTYASQPLTKVIDND